MVKELVVEEGVGVAGPGQVAGRCGLRGMDYGPCPMLDDADLCVGVDILIFTGRVMLLFQVTRSGVEARSGNVA